MNLLYDILVFKAFFLLQFIALFHQKIKLFVVGRKETFDKLSIIKKTDSVIWFHTASLGEFEQARSIIEEVKKHYRNYKIIVSFFSPSGYEIRKNYTLADVVCYLPLDSRKNARKFIEQIHPTIAIFVKYEFWPNFLNELKKQEILTILVAGILRKNQIFFKWYGGFMRKSLQAFHHFFVQDENSKNLLNAIHFNNVTLSGDTRFDRVAEILVQENSLDFIEEFKNGKYTVVAGSTWKEDEELLVDYINKSSKDEKFIIAPHTIKNEAIVRLKNSIQKKTVLYSNVISNTSNMFNTGSVGQSKNLSDFQVFIIDTIGLLTKIYSVADVAYVGGGLKTGLHNILEPATFGIPVVIGNQFSKFKEAVDLVNLKGCISVNNREEFSTIFTRLKSDENYRKSTGRINQKYIENNIGATKQIMNYLKKQL